MNPDKTRPSSPSDVSMSPGPRQRYPPSLPPVSPTESLEPSPAEIRANEQSEIRWLWSELERLRGQVRDCQIALSTSNEHGDLLQEHLYRLSTSLGAEI